MYICIYVICIYVYMYICIYVYMYICMFDRDLNRVLGVRSFFFFFLLPVSQTQRVMAALHSLLRRLLQGALPQQENNFLKIDFQKTSFSKKSIFKKSAFRKKSIFEKRVFQKFDFSNFRCLIFFPKSIFKKLVLLLRERPASHRSILIIVKIRYPFLSTGFGGPPTVRAKSRAGGGTKTRPIPAHRNGGHPDPLPTSVILHPISGCPLTGMSRNRVQDDGGWGGGSGGRGVDSRARGNNLGLLIRELLPTPTVPPSPQGPHLPTALTSEGGGCTLAGGWVGLGSGAARPPKPLPPPVPLAAFSALSRARQVGQVGVGALLGALG